MAEPQDYILPKRKGKLSLGVKTANGDELIQLFSGSSSMPSVGRAARTAEIHMEDELTALSEYKLTGGQLQIDVRTDYYVWGILDQVYADYFVEVATCEPEETWTPGSAAGATLTVEDDTINQRVGDGCKKLTGYNGVSWVSMSLTPLDISDKDYFGFFIYIEDMDKINSFSFQLGTGGVGGGNFEINTYSANPLVLHTGWNEVWVKIADMIVNDTPNAEAIDYFNVAVDVKTGQTVYFLMDSVRVCDSQHYPRRFFDVGLQTIPVAWWAGNTALFEIQTACESEGARFYCDEQGYLRFENRQHYNLDTAHKTSQWGFSFNRMNDLEFPGRESDVINKVVVKLKPRRVVKVAEEIWRYGFYPQIDAGETKTIWASLNDPCPTTAGGIIAPVATTDYTANTQEDGLGTDKTAFISIVTTKFANAVKLDVTNTDSVPIYLTMLALRGTPAKESDEVTITIQDDTSVAIFGEQPSGGLEIDNKYLADEVYAQTLAESLVDKYKNPTSRVVLKARAVPQLQLGDMITVNDPITARNYLTRITWMKTRLSISGGMEQEIHCRMVVPQETLSYFTIGSSTIESVDVIAP